MTATTSTRCDRCHADCPEHHVTVQRDGEALCYRCVDEFNEAMRAARKIELAARPACECCKRVGTWNVSGVRLCGTHKNRVQKARNQQTASWGILGLLGAPPLTREQILELAR